MAGPRGAPVTTAAAGLRRLLPPAAALALWLPTVGAGAQETSPTPSRLLLDPSMGSLSTTATLHAGVRAVYHLEDRGVPVRLGAEDGPPAKALGVGYRLARLMLLDLPVTGLHGIVRHEVGGHGGWIRQLGGEVRDYEIELPSPYGGGGGAVAFSFREVEAVGLAAVVAGGLESSRLDARELEERWVADGRMDYREALQYLYDVVELLGYVGDARAGPRRSGHDIENYVAVVNGAAPEGASGPAVRVGALQDAVRVELLNPTLYASLYTLLWRFLVQGDRNGPAPALGIGAVDVLPTVHLRLTPFGREHVFGGVAVWGRRVLRLGSRFGQGPWGGFGGLEVAGTRLFTPGDLELGGRLGLWRQYGLAGDSDEGELGGMALLRGTVALGEGPLEAAGELGWKTDGYVPGEALDAGPIVRAGFALPF